MSGEPQETLGSQDCAEGWDGKGIAGIGEERDPTKGGQIREAKS